MQRVKGTGADVNSLRVKTPNLRRCELSEALHSILPRNDISEITHNLLDWFAALTTTAYIVLLELLSRIMDGFQKQHGCV